jgi:tRNA uracil 4-sulfurtransferase
LAVHFHSYPYTSERSRQKVIDLARILTRFAGKIRLHIVPFTEIQTEIRQKCLESYSITVMRRMMFRIAEQLARREGALALVTGESLGQVASQTLESMNAINEVADLPVLRPLIGMDKQDIMSLSKEIGTYETSVLPYEDCCTVFMPRSPKTRPDLETTRKTESRLDVDRLVEAAVKGTEVLELVSGEEKEFTYF